MEKEQKKIIRIDTFFFTSLSSTRAAITTTTTKKCTNSRLMKKSSPKMTFIIQKCPTKKVMYVTNQKKKSIRGSRAVWSDVISFFLKSCTKMRLHHSHDDYSTSRMMVVMNDQLMVNWGILIEKLFWNFFWFWPHVMRYINLFSMLNVCVCFSACWTKFIILHFFSFDYRVIMTNNQQVKVLHTHTRIQIIWFYWK